MVVYSEGVKDGFWGLLTRVVVGVRETGKSLLVGVFRRLAGLGG